MSLDPTSAAHPSDPIAPPRARLRLGVRRRLDPRVVSWKRLGASIQFLIREVGLGLAYLGYFFFGDRSPSFPLAVESAAILLALAALLAMLFHRHWAWIDYRHSSYRIDAAGLEIRRGVWWRHVVRIPRSRIQHTDITQGPLQRRFGLATLVVHTAGTAHSRTELSGVGRSVAEALRDYLLEGRSSSDAV